MSKLGIGTGITPDDGNGDSLLDGAIKINSNFDEIYSYFGDGTNLSGSWQKVSSGITTTLNVGIATTNPRFALEVGAVGSSGTSLYVNGDARITGILTVGSSSITLDGSTNKINVGSGVTIDGSSGSISVTSIEIGGETSSGFGVTSITAGSGISIDQSTGNVTISASGGGGESYWSQTEVGIHTLSNVGIGTTNPTSSLDVNGTLNVSGVSTITGTTYFGDGSTQISNSGELKIQDLDRIMLGYSGGTPNGLVIRNNSSSNVSEIVNVGGDDIQIQADSGRSVFIGNDNDTDALIVNNSGIVVSGVSASNELNVGVGGSIIHTNSYGVGIGTTADTSTSVIGGSPDILTVLGRIRSWGPYDSEKGTINGISVGVDRDIIKGLFLYDDGTTPGGIVEKGVKITAIDENLTLSAGVDSTYNSVLINNNGVGIGTTNPTSSLDVNGTLNVSGVSTFSGNTRFYGNLGLYGTNNITFFDGSNNSIGNISKNGDITYWTRENYQKHIFQNSFGPPQTLFEIGPVNYSYKDFTVSGITSTKDLIVYGTGNETGSISSVALMSRTNYLDFGPAIPNTSAPQSFAIRLGSDKATGTFGPYSILEANWTNPSGSVSLNNWNGTGGISISDNGVFALSKPVIVGTATSTGTADQKLQVTGGAYVSDSVGIGTAVASSKLTVDGSVLITGIVTATSFVGDGSGLYGIVGSGSGVVIKDSGSTVGTAGTIDFGTNLSVSPISAGVVTVTASGGGGGESYWVSTPVGIHTLSNVGIATTNPQTPLQVENVYGVKTGSGTFTASAGIAYTADSYVASDFVNTEYTLFFQHSSGIQSQKVLVMDDGTTAYSQEYGIMSSSDLLVSVGATIKSGNVELWWTPEVGVNGITTYRFARHSMI